MTHSKLSVRKAFNVLHFHWPVKSWRMHAPLPNKIIRSCKIHLHRYLKSGKAIAKMSEDIFISFHLQKINEITVLHLLTRFVSWYTEILCLFLEDGKELKTLPEIKPPLNIMFRKLLTSSIGLLDFLDPNIITNLCSSHVFTNSQSWIPNLTTKTN